MRYYVDIALCAGHGRCAAVAPEVYSLDDDEGVNAELDRYVEVPAGLEAQAKAGAWACPDAAIRLFDDAGPAAG
jgi:ferredoxin